ncbi:unnamed protein product [Arctogadus glacialis]
MVSVQGMGYKKGFDVEELCSAGPLPCLLQHTDPVTNRHRHDKLQRGSTTKNTNMKTFVIPKGGSHVELPKVKTGHPLWG